MYMSRIQIYQLVHAYTIIRVYRGFLAIYRCAGELGVPLLSISWIDWRSKSVKINEGARTPERECGRGKVRRRIGRRRRRRLAVMRACLYGGWGRCIQTWFDVKGPSAR